MGLQTLCGQAGRQPIPPSSLNRDNESVSKAAPLPCFLNGSVRDHFHCHFPQAENSHRRAEVGHTISVPGAPRAAAVPSTASPSSSSSIGTDSLFELLLLPFLLFLYYHMYKRRLLHCYSTVHSLALDSLLPLQGAETAKDNGRTDGRRIMVVKHKQAGGEGERVIIDGNSLVVHHPSWRRLS